LRVRPAARMCAAEMGWAARSAATRSAAGASEKRVGRTSVIAALTGAASSAAAATCQLLILGRGR
jgi:hypothetical protein